MLSLSRASFRSMALIVAVFAGSSAHAIIATTSMTFDPANPGYDTVFTYVGGFGQGCGVAVAPNMVLTAGHVTADTFNLNGTPYAVLSKVYSTTSDLQLVTVAGTLPGYYNIASSVATNSTITMVGTGATGVVNSDNTGYNIVNSFGRRAGTNTVDAKQNVAGEGNSLLSLLNGPGQAALAGFDSGGGWFQNGMLVGTSAYTFKLDGYENSPDYGFYIYPAGDRRPYFGSGAIDLTSDDSRAFLLAHGITPGVQATPEPATCAALGLGALAVLRRRRRA